MFALILLILILSSWISGLYRAALYQIRSDCSALRSCCQRWSWGDPWVKRTLLHASPLLLTLFMDLTGGEENFSESQGENYHHFTLFTLTSCGSLFHLSHSYSTFKATSSKTNILFLKPNPIRKQNTEHSSRWSFFFLHQFYLICFFVCVCETSL